MLHASKKKNDVIVNLADTTHQNFQIFQVIPAWIFFL